MEDFQVCWRDINYSIAHKHAILNPHGYLNAASTFPCKIRARCLSTVCCHTKRRSYPVNQSREVIVDSAPSSAGKVERIIKNLNGSFKSSELTAIMGPSGAGKTSLMNFLSRRLERGFTGSLSLRGGGSKQKSLRISAIPQDNHMQDQLQVRENLLFAARIKTKQNSPQSGTQNNGLNLEEEVREVANLLGLSECLDTLTGSISGGQRKRLAIAQELLLSPSILLLDEPTSGLDSKSCFETLTVLKGLVEVSQKRLIDPIAIVLTIHQPEPNAFNLFDKLYVMANGGVAIYNGPPSDCARFLRAYHTGFIAQGTNDATEQDLAALVIEIAAGEHGQRLIDSLAERVRLDFLMASTNDRHEQDHFNKGDTIASRRVPTGKRLEGERENQIELETIGHTAAGQRKPFAVETQDTFCRTSTSDTLLIGENLIHCRATSGFSSLVHETILLLRRCWTLQMRARLLLAIRVAFQIYLPLSVAFVMGQEPGRAQACPNFKVQYSLGDFLLQNKDGRLLGEEVLDNRDMAFENNTQLFLVMCMSIFTTATIATLSLALDLRSSLKELHNQWYSTGPYLMGRLLVTLPFEVMYQTLTIVLLFVVSGQELGANGLTGAGPFWRILIASAGTILASFCGLLIGFVCGAISLNRITTAISTCAAVLIPLLLMAGYVPMGQGMASHIRLLSNLSPHRHAYDLIIVARYGYNQCTCNESEISPSGQVKMIGVSEKLKTFTREWFQSEAELARDISEDDGGYLAGGAIAYNVTATAGCTDNCEDGDFFQRVAQQISLYNTYGVKIKSCDDMVPYILSESLSREKDVLERFVSLIIIFLATYVLLFLVAKFLIRRKTLL